MTNGLRRRELLGLFRPKSQAAPVDAASAAGASEPKSFSLEAFYARREAPVPTFPRFAVHAPAEAIATTGVGVTRAPAPPWALARTASHALAAPPPGQKVRVVQSACLAWQGSPCWTCVERCPIEGAITTDGGRPTVDASLCDGCGQCVHACPAPTLALKFLDASAVKDPVA